MLLLPACYEGYYRGVDDGAIMLRIVLAVLRTVCFRPVLILGYLIPEERELS